MRRGNLIIVSGPSGAGKSALVGGVLRSLKNIRFSVSYTTRPPRGTEQDGVEYFFVERDAFEDLIAVQGAGLAVRGQEVTASHPDPGRQRMDHVPVVLA